MSDQSKIYTLGPTDPNAGTRAKMYSALTLVTPVLGFLATFGILSADKVSAINGAIAAATTLLGAFGLFGFGVAAKNTNKQLGNGTFDPVPAAPEINAFDALAQIKAQADAAVAEAQSKVAEGVSTIQGAVAMIPGGSILTGAVMSGPVGDLLKAVTALDRKG